MIEKAANTETPLCLKCGGPLSEGKSYLIEYAYDDYYNTYLHCGPCEQWYEEYCVDRKSLGIKTTFEPITKAEMEGRCLHWEQYVDPFDP